MADVSVSAITKIETVGKMGDDILLLFPESPSETFIGLRHTPHTPRLDLRGNPAAAPPRLEVGGGP